MADKETTIQWKVNLEGQDNLSKNFNTIQSAGEKLKNTFASIPTRISEVATGFIAANVAMFAGEKALELVKEAVIGSIEEYDRLQHSLYLLKNAMDTFGIYTKDNFDTLTEFADKITMITGSLHNESIEVAARNAAYGESTKQIEAQLKAASILVEISGHTLSLTEANNMLIQSYSGMTKGLARYSPEIKTLSQEHAKAGGAVDILNEKYKNLTFTIGQTKEGIARQRAVLIESTQEKLGALFSPSLEGAQASYAALKVALDITVSLVGYIKQLFTYFLSIGELVANLIIDIFKTVVNLGKLLYNTAVNFIDLLVTGIEGAGSKIGAVITKALGFSEVGKSLDKKADEFGKKFEGIQARIAADFANPVVNVDEMIKDLKNGSKDILTQSQLMANSFTEVGKKILDAPEAYKQAMKDIQAVIKASSIEAGKMNKIPLLTEDEIKEMRKKYQEFINGFETDDYTRFKQTLDLKFKDIQDFYRRGAISKAEFEKALTDMNEALNLKQFELGPVKWITAVTSGFTGIINQAIDSIFNSVNKEKIQDFIGNIQNGITSLLGEDSGIGQMLNSALDSLSAIIPGLGAAIKPIVQFMTMAPEQTKQFVNGIIDAIEQFFKNIATQIPLIFDTITERLPELINTIVISVISSLPVLLINSITSFMKALSTVLFKMLFSSDFWNSFATGLRDAFVDALSNLKDVFSDFFASLFFGSSDKIVQAATSASQALFNNNADAGTNKFQLKDMATERTAAALNQGIDAVITKGQKGLFQMLYEGIQGIFNQIWSGFINVFSSLGSYFYNFGNYIWYGFVQYIGSFFYDLGKQIWNGLSDSITSIGGSVGGIFGGGGGGILGSIGGAIGSIGGSFGFAEGGLVGGSAPFAGNSSGNDIVPAMLSPGEFVVNRQQMSNKDLSGVMNAMGISGGGGISLTINIASGASITENQLKQNFIPIIISELKKASSNGTQILSKRGVY